jgi:hypothetical protein
MVQTYKILHGHDKVKSDTLFVRADQANVPTRSATGHMNLGHQAARLEARLNFFSQRVVENWNKVPTNIKMVLVSHCLVHKYISRDDQNMFTMAGEFEVQGQGEQQARKAL